MIEKTQEMLLDPAEGETVIAEGVSFENFLRYFSEQHTEWLVGKVIRVVTNNTQHNEILAFLVTLINLFLMFKPVGRLLLAGVPMRISDDRPAREPDLLFILNENTAHIKTTYIDGPADLVVEIVSPESVDRDRAKKLLEYESAGVKEYWLVDPIRTEWVIYALGSDEHYHPRPLDSEGRLTSAVLPGFALQPALLWQETLPNNPDLIELVRKMAGA